VVELRWAIPAETTTQAPRLQYRNWGAWPAPAGPWLDVPTVVVPQEPPKPAPSVLSAFGLKTCPVCNGEGPLCAVCGNAGVAACRAEQRGASEWVCDCAAPGPNCKPTGWRAHGVKGLDQC
jgi:hypothetical protein